MTKLEPKMIWVVSRILSESIKDLPFPIILPYMGS